MVRTAPPYLCFVPRNTRSQLPSPVPRSTSAPRGVLFDAARPPFDDGKICGTIYGKHWKTYGYDDDGDGGGGDDDDGS